LKDLRDSGCVLSSRSIELISIDTVDKRALFVNEIRDIELSQWTCISCMDVLKLDSEELDAISLLVVGTEHSQVFILPEDPTGSNFLCKINLPSVPVMFTISGTFDVEWRIVVACRDGKIYSIKNGDDRRSAVLTGTVIDPGASQVVSMQILDKNVWVRISYHPQRC
jgi:Bardet-Biedl syndrome 1 protein